MSRHDIRRVREIPGPSGPLEADLTLPDAPIGLVLFSHPSGFEGRIPRNDELLENLRRRGIAALCFDLLTSNESADPRQRYDIALLARRLVDAAGWSSRQPETGDLPIGFLGSGLGTSAALSVAADLGPRVRAVVSRSGRPDLVAPRTLARVTAPTLLIVGELDRPTVKANLNAMNSLGRSSRLECIPGAGHFFTEAGASLRVARESALWFEKHFREPPVRRPLPQ